MARLPRLALAGELHCLLLRGHAGQPVFADPADRDAFVDTLRQVQPGAAVSLHAYVLMPNAAHLLATPAQAGALGRLMQAVGRRFGAAYNRRHGRQGALWDGRFRCGVLDSARYLIDATAHLESLPVEAGLVAHPADWRWSSAAHHLGRRRDPLIIEHAMYWNTGNTPFEREQAHADFLAKGVARDTSAQLDQAVQRSHALGGASFLARISQAVDRPVGPRRRGRPAAAKRKP